MKMSRLHLVVSKLSKEETPSDNPLQGDAIAVVVFCYIKEEESNTPPKE